jgi:drug/metabolite transporter (DMT)-like permease
MPTAPGGGAAPRDPAATRGAPSTLALATGLLAVYVIWGSTYLGIRIAIETMPPFLMVAVRFVVAGLLMIGVDLVRSPHARHLPTNREIRDAAIVGMLLLGVGNGFVAFGEQTVPSGIAAILIGLVPVWFALLGWIYFRDRLPRLTALGVAIGFAGVALLVWPEGAGANRFDPLGILILFIAPLGWAHGSLFAAHRAVLPRRPFVSSGIQMLAGAVLVSVESVLTGEPSRFDPGGVSWQSLVAVGYLVIFGSMVGYTTYNWLLRNAPLSLVGTYAYVNPVVAVVLGMVFLGEVISPRTIVAAAVIVAAVAIVVSTRGRLAQAEARGSGPRVSSSAPSSPRAPSG